jgi:prepilin-type N-terminal cleavage/methylation domain-containing protein
VIQHRLTISRGYTLVELMMAITVFAIGVMGIAAMQKITLGSNLHAKKLATATHIAQSWQERLAADGSLWLAEAPNASRTQWLDNPTGNWMRAPSDAEFGPSFGPLGEYVSNPGEAYFCVNIRLSSMSSAGTALPGNGLVRSEVLVFWPREGREPATPYCEGTNVDIDADAFHYIHNVSAVRQNQ